MKLVLVQWVDSAQTIRWTYLDEIRETPLQCASAGWIVKKTKEALTIAPHVSAEQDKSPHQGCGSMTIPMKAISKITELRHDRR